MKTLMSVEDSILVPGCGNAPLSADMYDAGFVNQLNFDTSSVVIEQMRKRHASRPQMQWKVMDCNNTGLPDGAFSRIIDKGLIDTLRCCDGSVELCEAFAAEMRRLLTPTGIFITMSLNEYSGSDIRRYYQSVNDWKVAWVHLPNPNYEAEKDNSQFYTLIVCSLVP